MLQLSNYNYVVAKILGGQGFLVYVVEFVNQKSILFVAQSLLRNRLPQFVQFLKFS